MIWLRKGISKVTTRGRDKALFSLVVQNGSTRIDCASAVIERIRNVAKPKSTWCIWFGKQGQQCQKDLEAIIIGIYAVVF
jgi:hypothetical protein